MEEYIEDSNRGSHRTIYLRLAMAVILAVSLYQLFRVGQVALHLGINKVWENRKRDALSRGADVAYGYEYMKYIEFILTEIPPDATVIVLSKDDQPQYKSKSFLQYFLIPRKVTYCHSNATIKDCILDNKSPNTYFTYGRGFQLSDEAIGESYTQREFNEGRGILIPTSLGEDE